MFEIDVAIGLNSENPLPDMAPLLYRIRAQFGPEVSVALCTRCHDLSIVL